MDISTKHDDMFAVNPKLAWDRLRADYASQSCENSRLQEIIVRAYQRLGFTSHKNETMRILGTGLPNTKDSGRVSEEQKPEFPEPVFRPLLDDDGTTDSDPDLEY